MDTAEGSKGLSGPIPPSQLSPEEGCTTQVGGRNTLNAHRDIDTKQVALLPLGHTRKLLHSQATEALCAQSPPVPSLTSP